MTLSRRSALGLALGASAMALSGHQAIAQSTPFALQGDVFDLNLNEIIIHPINHASLLISINGTIIYVDPVGPRSRYNAMPAPDFTLLTHEHSDHYDPELLRGIVSNARPLITNPAVYSKLPASIKSSASPMENGENRALYNMMIEAVPAYNTTADRKHFHPKGRDNGYILNVEQARIYIAGDTEDIPEMRALTNIDIAFVPMILPWTMDETQAASAVNEFTPSVVYPYHYGPSDIGKFKSLIEATNASTDVRFAKWY